MGKKYLLFLLVLFVSCTTYGQKITPAGPVDICVGGSVVLKVEGVIADSVDTYKWRNGTIDISGNNKDNYLVNASGNYSVIIFYKNKTVVNDTLGPVKVTVNGLPIITAIDFTNGICSGTSVNFKPTVSNGKQKYSYAWDFGDGKTSIDESPNHAFTSYGCGTANFTVKLTVTDANGCASSTFIKTITVKESPLVKIIDKDIFSPFNNCSKNPTPDNPNFNIEIDLDGNSSGCVGAYTVDWGDGTPTINNAIFPLKHTYTKLGAFILKVKTTGANGCEGLFVHTVANQSNPAGGLGTLGSTTGLCAPATVPFIISNWQNNSPGTIYHLEFGDGESIELTHPLNSSMTAETVSHIYDKTSCPGTSFTATLSVINACDLTPYTAGNIQVRIAPKANFTSKLNVCVGESVLFDNITKKGSTGNNCSDVTTYEWDFGDLSSKSNLESPSHVFSKSGKYIVELIATNPCGKTIHTVEICVEDRPAPSFILDKLVGCKDLTVKATNKTVDAATCTPITYEWKVNYTATNCGTTPLWSFTAGSSATSKDATFIFKNPGTYRISLSAKNSCGIITTLEQLVVVKQPPTVALTGISDSYCGSVTIKPKATVVNCGTVAPSYSWLIDGVEKSTSLDPGDLVFNTVGSYTITLNVKNECSTTTQTKQFKINPIPVVNVPTDKEYCPGEVVNGFTFTASPASTITWSSSKNVGFSPLAGTGSIGQFTTVNNTSTDITAIVSVTAKAIDGGCPKTETFKIIVHPTPPIPTGTATVLYCKDAFATPLSANATAGNSLLWYSTPTGGVGNSSAPTPSTATVGSKIYYVSQKNNVTGCESLRLAITVTVNAIPTIGSAIPTNPSACKKNDGQIKLIGLNANTTYLVSYNGKASTPMTSNGAGEITMPKLMAGAYDIIVSLNGCPSNTVSASLSDPSAPEVPTVGSNSPVCEGSKIELKANTTTSGTITYNWQGPNSYSSLLQNPTIAVSTLSSAGNYQVTATQAGCTSAAGIVNVVVNPTPKVSISGTTPICSGSDLQLNSSTAFSNPFTYAWTGPNFFTSANPNPKITNAQSNVSGIYKLIITATTGNCPSPEATINVVVNPTPVINNLVKSDPANCASSTGSITFDVSEANKSFTVNYLQAGVPKTATKVSSTDKKIKIQNLPAGTYSKIYIVSDAKCSSNELGPITLSDPNPPATPTATSNGPICSNNDLQLNSNTIANATYNWSGPNGFSSVLQNPKIAGATMSATGIYSVTVTVAGCSSPAGTVDVMVNQTPTVNISSNSPICSGSDLELKSTTSFVDALTYAWTGPNGFTSGLKNPIISNATVSNGGSYHLKITSSELCFSEQTISVAVNQTLTITASPNDPLNCAQLDGSIIIHGLIKNSFYTIGYTKNAEAPIVRNNISSDVNGDAIIIGLGQGDYTKIYVILNNCPSNEVSVSLKDPSSPIIKSISNNGPLCAGSTLNLISNTDPGVSYSWSGPNGFLSTTQNPLKPNVTSADGGKYTLIIEKNKCSSSASTDVIINAQPTAPVVNDVEYCIGSPATPISATPSVGNSLKWYTTFTGGIGSLIAPTPQTTLAGTTSYFVSQTDGNSCESKRAEIKVIIHPDAVAEFTPTNIIDCPPFTINTKDIGLKEFPLNNKLYQWYADGTYIGEGITFPGYTIPNEDETITIQLKTSSLFGCKDAEVSHTFSTYKLPHPVFTLSTVEGCGPLTVSISNTTPNPTFFNYFWDFGNGTSSSNANPGDVIFASSPDAGDTVYVVKLKVWNNCDTVVVEKSVRVKSKPLALFTPSKTEGCSPMTVTFTNTTKGENVTYIWDFGDGQMETTNSAGEVTHTYNTGKPTTFTVRLTATNNCGTDFKEYKIVVSPNPIKLKFAMNGPDHFGCEPHTIVIDNNTSGASSFYWDFGDGNFLSTTKGVDQIQHTYLTPGDYTITVKASNNCTDTIAYDYVHVYPKPKAAFTANRYVVCIGDELNFKNESLLATSYLWEFGDGITSTLSDPKHIYKNAGLYTVKLTVFKLNGPGSTCTETVEQKIQVNTIMPGSITMSATEADCAPFTISFENDVKPSVTAIWDFGDGNTGVGDAIQHTYQSSGIYQVTLTITVPGGCTYVTQKTVTIKGPSGTFNYTSGFTCSTDAVRLEAHATGTDAYFWDFGDGNNQTTTTPIVYHTYTNGGTYLPTVTFKNNTGCNYFVKGMDSIKVDKIEAGFVITQEKTCGITKVNFSDTSHVLFGKKEILWNFGDGAEGVGANVSHTYTASGIYTMTMTITGNSNCQEIITKNIEVHVNNNPIVVITAKTEGCNNKSASFSANINSVDEINTIKWGISNGITGSGKSFDYLFLIPGTYTITWTVGTVNGCLGTATHTITINPSPIVKASADVIVCLGNSTQLSVSGAPNYQWSPLEGLSCTNCANPIAKPIVSTTYLVEGVNGFGCVDTDTVIVTVIKPLQMTNSGNDSICIGKSVNLLMSGAASYLWTPSQGLSSTTISNPIANPIITTIYRVVGYDGYNCFTDTAFIVVGVGDYPTVNLGPDQTLSTGTIFPLKTTITNGPIKNWLWTPTANLDCINCSLPNAHIKKDITYTVKVTTSYGCEASDTINIKVFCENTQVFIPNAFTPDGDGVNDILMVRGTGIVTVKSFRIFNRWGELVFEKNNFPPNEPSYGWDGRVKGKMSSSEVYVYTAEVLCENGVSFIYKGNTTILK